MFWKPQVSCLYLFYVIIIIIVFVVVNIRMLSFQIYIISVDLD